MSVTKARVKSLPHEFKRLGGSAKLPKLFDLQLFLKREEQASFLFRASGVQAPFRADSVLVSREGTSQRPEAANGFSETVVSRVPSSNWGRFASSFRRTELS